MLHSASLMGDSESDPSQLAAQLVKRGKLTGFQASALLKGEPELLIDKYLILDLLDSGGMGMVFKAIHRPMNRLVAIKMISQHLLASPDLVKRFRREVRVAATLEHPNIVRSYDADQSGGVQFLVMEYVRGENLTSVIQSKGPLSLEMALDYIFQAAKGLRHAHKHGIIHRDIKPGNLMVSEDGQVKVLDLGLANIDGTFGKAQQSIGNTEEEYANSSPVGGELTAAGTLLGTVSFMAPEQSLDAKLADARSDIYSLGCTLYFLLIGDPPFKGETMFSVFLQHRDGEIPSIRDKRPDVSEGVETVCRKMLAKRPDDRFQSTGELIAALEDCDVVLPERKTQFQINQKSKKRRPNEVPDERVLSLALRRSRIVWAAAGVACLVAFAYGGFQLWDASRRTQKSDLQWPQNQPAKAIAPFGADQAKQYQEEWAKHLGVEVETTNSIGMKFRVIPPGEFLMRSSNEEIAKLVEESVVLFGEKSRETLKQLIKLEGPQHNVSISIPFAISKHEVTRGQFRQFVDDTGFKTDAEKDGLGGGGIRDNDFARSPEFLWNTDIGFSPEQTDVVNVSWNDAVAFCSWLSKKERETYRLPTEAEWEFACGSGSLARYSFGNDKKPLESYAWFGNNGGKGTKKVGQKISNVFGLFDMYGNVFEWCFDWLGPYSSLAAVDPVGPSEGSMRIMRGGSYFNQPTSIRSAERIYRQPDFRNCPNGFRPVRVYELSSSNADTPDPAPANTATRSPGLPMATSNPSPVEIDESHLSGHPALLALLGKSDDWEWTDPQNLGATINSTGIDSEPHLSVDGLRLYFASSRNGGESMDIYISSRLSLEEPFGSPQRLFGEQLNSPLIKLFFVYSGGQIELRSGRRVFVLWGELNESGCRLATQNTPYVKQGDLRIVGKTPFGLQTPRCSDSEQVAHNEAQVT